MPDRTVGIYNGKVKDAEADSIFASIATLSMKQHLERFAPDAFDLIVIDEFHQYFSNKYIFQKSKILNQIYLHIKIQAADTKINKYIRLFVIRTMKLRFFLSIRAVRMTMP